MPEADAGIATLWVTAYALAHAPNMRRKFYLIQDYEPMFYPASTLYALAEETYRLGLYGLCNTDNLRRIYARRVRRQGRWSFTPGGRPDGLPRPRAGHQRTPGRPGDRVRLRPARPLAQLLGDGLAGPGGAQAAARRPACGSSPRAPGRPERAATTDIKHLGLLDYRATGELYRNSDVGLALTVSKHPSYLPLELMACGVPVVAFDNPWGHWILEDEENSLLAKRTVDDLADQLERLCADAGAARAAVRRRRCRTSQPAHGDWDAALAPIYDYLCDPEGRRG